MIKESLVYGRSHRMFHEQTRTVLHICLFLLSTGRKSNYMVAWRDLAEVGAGSLFRLHLDNSSLFRQVTTHTATVTQDIERNNKRYLQPMRSSCESELVIAVRLIGVRPSSGKTSKRLIKWFDA